MEVELASAPDHQIALTDPDAPVYQGMSMFVVPADTPGIEIIRNVGVADDPEATHAYLNFDGVRVGADCMLGEPGAAFAIAQVRLGGGRVHHAMRVIGQAQAVRPQVVGAALADVQKKQAVADALFKLLDIKATLKSTGKVLIAPSTSVGLLLQG